MVIADGSDLRLPDILPVLALKDTVVFPYVIVPLSVEPVRGVPAVDEALAGPRLVMMTAHRDSSRDVSSLDDLYDLGTVGLIMRMLKLPDGRIRILAQGLSRARLDHLSQIDPFLRARIHEVEPEISPDADLADEAMVRSVRDHLEKAMHLGKPISPEIMVLAANLDDPGRMADLAASNLELPIDQAQEVLELADPVARLRRVNELLLHEIELLNMQQKISNQAQGEIDRSQREYYLRHQLKAIQDELGDSDELADEIKTYRQAAEEQQLPDHAVHELDKQVARLERSHPESGESSVIRSYLDWLTTLPWGVRSTDNLELAHARRILDEDHFGLDEVKRRILEFLAVRNLNPGSKGPILCFVGPPGVGKTSLGRSIARALDRRFVRISLGGVRDEAEIRGHRRTYVGAMPGRIVQSLHQAKTGNPVFMLDEIDKIGADHRGDPSSALLEVLDPEQNNSFRDHYLGISYDLSPVIFIATANLLDPIQPAFLDRMEVIRLSGYTEEEKVTIARRHLIPKQLQENGVDDRHIRFTEPGIRQLIRGYTREAGLRNLEREIASICRKVAVRVAEGDERRSRIDARTVAKLLGPEKNFNEALLDRHRIGVATGLAWTAAGGDLLMIEAIIIPGRGQLRLTGRLGEVMRESAQAALTYARKHIAEHPEALDAEMAASLLDNSRQRSSLAHTEEGRVATADVFTVSDIHIHAPAGSIPKDGPSAGITIATAILSALGRRPVHRQVAMTGEITLRGDIMPIGGLKEKALAARSAGIATVIIPAHNAADVGELPASLRRKLTFVPLAHMDQVLARALLEPDQAAND